MLKALALQQMDRLDQAVEVLGQALNLDQALQALLSIVSDSLAMRQGAVILQDPETGRLRICASHGLSPAGAPPGLDPLDEGFIGLVCRTAQPFDCHNLK